MSMTEDRDQCVNADFMWKNQPWGDLRNSENLGESRNQKSDKILMNQKCGINEGEVLVNKKRNRGGVVIRTENNMSNEEEKDGKYHNSDKEMHILCERERRKKMKNRFSDLHALLPELPSKADRSSIVDAAVEKIINLKQVLEKLENKKQEKLKSVSKFGIESSFMWNSHLQPYESREAIAADNFPISIMKPPSQQVAFNTWSSPNVVLNICGTEAQFCICSTKKSCFLTTISYILEKYRIDVVTANIMLNENGHFYMIQIQAKQGSLDTSSMEQTYNQAAREIMAWIS